MTPARSALPRRLPRHWPLLTCAALAAVWGLRALAATRAAEATPAPTVDAAAAPSEVLVQVGPRAITRADLAGRGAYRWDLNYHESLGEDRSPLQDAIEEELLFQEALRRGLEQSDYVVRRRLARLVMQRDVLSPIAFDLDEATTRAYYEAHVERFSGPAGPIPYDLCRTRVRADLVETRFGERYQALIDRLWTGTSVTVYDAREAASLASKGLAVPLVERP